jgi:hypothetical protein
MTLPPSGLRRRMTQGTQRHREAVLHHDQRRRGGLRIQRRGQLNSEGCQTVQQLIVVRRFHADIALQAVTGW